MLGVREGFSCFSPIFLRSVRTLKPRCVLPRVWHHEISTRFASQDSSVLQSNLNKSKSKKWYWIPIPLGLGLVGTIKAKHIMDREREKKGELKQAKDWQFPAYFYAKRPRATLVRSISRNSAINLYRSMPLRSMSRAWGKFNAMDLPEWSRKPLLSIYVRMFGCNLEEAAVEDLRHYRNLGEFFRRALKPGTRVIDPEHSLVSPSDGKVLTYGRVHDGVIEEVKGVTYSLKGFLGPNNQKFYQSAHLLEMTEPEIERKLRKDDENLKKLTDSQYYNSLLHNKHNRLYHMVIYLAPGDYHRFHSPADWTVELRRHFPGELLSVNPSIARWVQGLFNLNERAVYYGSWKHGFFSMSAVGATNVGSIKTYFDQDLQTNLHGHTGKDMKYFDQQFTGGIPLRKGEPFGEFNLGSTIVLIFEAPKNFDFHDVELNGIVRMGQAFGDKETQSETEQKSENVRATFFN